MNKVFSKENIIRYIIIIVVVGLLSLIPHMITGNNHKTKEVKLTKDKTFKFDDLEYSIPKGFIVHEGKYYNEMRYYTLYTDNNSCSIEITKSSNYNNKYKDGKDYLKSNVYFTLNDEISEITENDQIQKNWYTIIKDSNSTDRIEITSAYVKKDVVYVVEYHYSDYAKGDYEEEDNSSICENASDYVLSHLKVN